MRLLRRYPKCQHRLPSPKSDYQIFAVDSNSVSQFSPSHFLSVSDLTRQANCTEPLACQVQHIDTSWGKKVNLCWQMLTAAVVRAGWTPGNRNGRKKIKTPLVCRRKIRAKCPPNPQTVCMQKYEKVTFLGCFLSLHFLAVLLFATDGRNRNSWLLALLGVHYL